MIQTPARQRSRLPCNPADGEGKPGLAEAVYFRSPAGAKVFTAGSIRWAWGLGKIGFEREAF